MKKALPLLGLLLILALAFGLRRFGWNWDEGQMLHPDERHMAMVTAAVESPDGFLQGLNGATSPFTPYTQGIHSYVYGQLPLKLVHSLSVEKDLTDLKEIIRIGRWLSALFSTGTVLLLYLFGRRLHSPACGLLAAGLQAFVILSIQLAHFYTVDSFGTFFTTACIGLGLLYHKEQKLHWLIFSGAMVGVAMACRINLALLAPWLTLLVLMQVWKKRSPRPAIGLIIGGLLALGLFRILQPMAFAGWGLNETWLNDLHTVNGISRGTMEVPFTLQWVGRIPYVYALTQWVRFSIGLPLGLTVLAAIAWCIARSPSRTTDWRFAAALWPVLLFAYHGRIFLHTQRYFAPAIPIGILCAAALLWSIKPLQIRKGLIAGIGLCSLAIALAFSNLYRAPHPRIEASEWLIEQLPFGGTVLTEHWDDALPLRLGQTQSIQTPQLEVYAPESPEKLHRMLEQIEEADFLVLSSTRASETLPRMPMRYPVMTRFYAQLENQDPTLGLKEAARFHRRPHLAGLEIHSLQAEEAYRVYDHPLVRIYEKTDTFDVDEVFAALTAGIDFEILPEIRYLQAGKSNAGWLSPEQLERRAQGPTAGELFDADALGARMPILIWAFVLQATWVVGFPVCFILFPSLRDRGYAVCRLLGLMILTWLAWLPAALELLPFRHSLLLAGMISVACSTGLFVWKWDEMLPWYRKYGKRILPGEFLCWSVFVLFLGLRMLQPELWHPWAGGEKPMDLAFLNATSLTEFFPPENPWMSGAFINYYYYGFTLVAVMIRMTGVPPEIAYNLALPTFAFFTAGAVFSLASALAPLMRKRGMLIGLLAVGCTLFLGNLGQVREYLRPDFPSHPRDVYWNASRAIQVPAGEVHPITEFPLFSHLYGDLHAHLMALPIAVLCLLMSWQLFRRFHPLRVVAISLSLGTLWITNTWDLPIQLAVFGFVCLLPAWKDQRWVLRGLTFIGGILLAKLLFHPFHLRFESMPLKLQVWQGPRSHPFDLFLVHGLFLIPIVWGGILWFRSKPKLTRYHLLPLLLVTGCVFTIGFLEGFHISGDIGRMNIVFKFYYQIWWILAVLTAVIFLPLAGKKHLPYTCVSGLLLLGGLLYPFTAIPAKVNEWGGTTPKPTTNGLAYMRHTTWQIDNTPVPLGDDLQVIYWLRKNAPTRSVLLEANRSIYQWGGRISWHTGLPSVLGWEWHMRQQRPWPGGGNPVRQRQQDIEHFFRTADPEILDRYHVDYVILGHLERITYGEEALNNIKAMDLLTPVFTSNGSTIYKINVLP